MLLGLLVVGAPILVLARVSAAHADAWDGVSEQPASDPTGIDPVGVEATGTPGPAPWDAEAAAALLQLRSGLETPEPPRSADDALGIAALADLRPTAPATPDHQDRGSVPLPAPNLGHMLPRDPERDDQLLAQAPDDGGEGDSGGSRDGEGLTPVLVAVLVPGARANDGNPTTSVESSQAEPLKAQALAETPVSLQGAADTGGLSAGGTDPQLTNQPGAVAVGNLQDQLQGDQVQGDQQLDAAMATRGAGSTSEQATAVQDQPDQTRQDQQQPVEVAGCAGGGCSNPPGGPPDAAAVDGVWLARLLEWMARQPSQQQAAQPQEPPQLEGEQPARETGQPRQPPRPEGGDEQPGEQPAQEIDLPQQAPLAVGHPAIALVLRVMREHADDYARWVPEVVVGTLAGLDILADQYAGTLQAEYVAGMRATVIHELARGLRGDPSTSPLRTLGTPVVQELLRYIEQQQARVEAASHQAGQLTGIKGRLQAELANRPQAQEIAQPRQPPQPAGEPAAQAAGQQAQEPLPPAIALVWSVILGHVEDYARWVPGTVAGTLWGLNLLADSYAGTPHDQLVDDLRGPVLDELELGLSGDPSTSPLRTLSAQDVQALLRRVEQQQAWVQEGSHQADQLAGIKGKLQDELANRQVLSISLDDPAVSIIPPSTAQAPSQAHAGTGFGAGIRQPIPVPAGFPGQTNPPDLNTGYASNQPKLPNQTVFTAPDLADRPLTRGQEETATQAASDRLEAAKEAVLETGKVTRDVAITGTSLSLLYYLISWHPTVRALTLTNPELFKTFPGAAPDGTPG